MAKKMFMFHHTTSAFYHVLKTKGFRAINPIVLSFNQLIWKNNIVFFLLIRKTSLSLQ